jgi:hypothetical protein
MEGSFIQGPCAMVQGYLWAGSVVAPDQGRCGKDKRVSPAFSCPRPWFLVKTSNGETFFQHPKKKKSDLASSTRESIAVFGLLRLPWGSGSGQLKKGPRP